MKVQRLNNLYRVIITRIFNSYLADSRVWIVSSNAFLKRRVQARSDHCKCQNAVCSPSSYHLPCPGPWPPSLPVPLYPSHWSFCAQTSLGPCAWCAVFLECSSSEVPGLALAGHFSCSAFPQSCVCWASPPVPGPLCHSQG